MRDSMKYLQAALISFCTLIAVPAFGQSDMIKEELRGSGAMLVYFGEDGGAAAAAKMQTILRSDELIDMGLRQQVLTPQSENTTEITQQLRISLGSNWALVDSNGFSIAQWDTLPSAEAISAELQRVGIRSPIKVLREFLKQHPDHLAARIDLLTRLRAIAEKRTIRALKLNDVTADEMPIGQYPHNLDTWLNIDSEIAKYSDKALDTKDDIEIWGPYAQEMDVVFSTGEWRLITNFIRPGWQIPLEACSATMAALYRRHLPKVIEALRERPGNLSEWLWRTYAWMRGTSKDKSPIRVLLTTLPAESNFAQEMVDKEDRENNRWDALAERLWARRKSMLANQYSIHAQITGNSRFKDVQGLNKRAEIEAGKLLNLLEVLIKVSRTGDAEYVVKTFAKFPHNANFVQKAADLAIQCGRPDLATEWRGMRIEELSKKRDLEYLEAVLPRGGAPIVVLVNGEVDPILPLLASLGAVALKNKQLNQLLESEEFVEWQLECAALNSELSALMQQREGWSGNEVRWAVLVNADGELKVSSSGLGMPSAKDLAAALEHAKAEKPADRLKRLVKENPSYYGALEELAPILLASATAKTKAKIAQTKAGELSLDDDALIWGEYALYYRKLINYLANNLWLLSHWEPVHVDTYETLKYSPAMKALCRELLPLISATIQKLPDEHLHWDLWTMLFDPSRDTQFSDFLDSIVPSPLQEKYASTYNLTAGVVLRAAAAKKYKLNGNWSGVVNALEPFWESLRSQGELRSDLLTGSNQYNWSNSILPLIEAYLNLGRDASLKEWVAMWKESRHWKSIEAEVAKLYEKYGKS